MPREAKVRFEPWVKISDEQYVRPGFIGKQEAITLFATDTPRGWQWSIAQTGRVPLAFPTVHGLARNASDAKAKAERRIGIR
jgi:hypothetical protein